jgi:hypothetical protein
VQLYGKLEERRRKLDWYATSGLCADCYRSRQAQQRAQASAQAASTNAAQGLPALTGTDKQIAWAESIRADRLHGIEAARKLRERINAIMPPGVSPETAAAFRARANLLLDDVINRTSAHEWIDARAEVYDTDWLRRDAECERLARTIEAEATHA